MSTFQKFAAAAAIGLSLAGCGSSVTESETAGYTAVQSETADNFATLYRGHGNALQRTAMVVTSKKFGDTIVVFSESGKLDLTLADTPPSILTQSGLTVDETQTKDGASEAARNYMLTGKAPEFKHEYRSQFGEVAYRCTGNQGIHALVYKPKSETDKDINIVQVTDGPLNWHKYTRAQVDTITVKTDSGTTAFPLKAAQSNTDAAILFAKNACRGPVVPSI